MNESRRTKIKYLSKVSCGLTITIAILSNVANAGALEGKYKCSYKAMDLDFKLEFASAGKYSQDMDFIGLEKGNYSISGNIISFVPTEKTRGGKKKKVPNAHKKNIVSKDDKVLIMTNINDSDQFICKK